MLSIFLFPRTIRIHRAASSSTIDPKEDLLEIDDA